MIRLSTAILLTTAWFATAAAQDATKMEEVQVTAGRAEQTTSDVPAGVSVVDTDALERQTPAIVADLLRGVTGAFVQQTTPGQGIPIIRGLKGSEVLHLVDGMRLNNALFRNAPNQYLALVDPHIVSRLEVVRGPSPSLYGADAMGGVVQLVTALPEIGVAPVFLGRLALDYASADAASLSHLMLAKSGEELAYALSASYQDVGDRKAGNNTQLSNSAFTSRAARAVVRAL
ncbi:MAG: TonB-dependent receptor plug domain-containing protein, partial [Gammaproteobacteria bacterium]|nr:TonB-dependent receptor plug domain-containing protein [Gammaproteobacteria bacterium]